MPSIDRGSPIWTAGIDCEYQKRTRRRLATPFADLLILRKEVIQPQVPLRLPCYDFTPVADLTVDGHPLAVGATGFR